MSNTVVNKQFAKAVSAVVSLNHAKAGTKDEDEFQTRMCFGNVPNQVNTKAPRIYLWFPDMTTAATGTDKLSEAYLNDLDKYLGKYFIEERVRDNSVNGMLQEEMYGTAQLGWTAMKVLANSASISGKLFLGFMNLYKTIGEHPYVPVTYSILKRDYPQLKFYQRLVASHYLAPKDWCHINNQHVNGQHTAFRKEWLVHIKGLTLSRMVDYWTKEGLLFPKKGHSLAEVKDFTGYDATDAYSNYNEETMNYAMLPPPFSDPEGKKWYPNSLQEINAKTVEFMLDNTKGKSK